MNKKIYTFFAIALFLILLIWEADRSSTIRIDWRTVHEVMPLAGLLLWLLVFAAVVYIINAVVHKAVKKQLDEALSITDGTTDENQSIDKLEDISPKLVLSRKDMDKAFLDFLAVLHLLAKGGGKSAAAKLEELQKTIGNDVIIDILRFNIYKQEKDFGKMEALSAKLAKNAEILQLKHSIEEQICAQGLSNVLQEVGESLEVCQDLGWIIESAFKTHAQNGQWEEALQILDSGHKKDLIPVERYKQLKAVALYQIALGAKEKKDSVNFFKFCSQAVKYNPKLVPASLSLAEYYVENDNQVRKAAQVLSNIWRINPTTEIAEAYLRLWPEDSAVERVQRMESLALTNSIRPSLNNLLLAGLDMNAELWGKAKSEFEIFLVNNPATKRIAEIISEYELKVNQDKEKASSWKHKIKDCAEDSLWSCNACGHFSKNWQPICKKCGAIGEYKWRLYKQGTENK